MDAEFCRNGRHPASMRVRDRSGKSDCKGCRTERWEGRNLACRGERATLSAEAVEHATERQARYDTWAAWLDAAILAIRRTEGFDGRERTWRTLGEFLRPAPAPAWTWRTRPIVACPDCGAARFEGRPCRHCADLPRSPRFQALARLDIGALIDLDTRRLADVR